jgi:FKBP-type peptidyl-prolyl cis-trans isomerase SlyD
MQITDNTAVTIHYTLTSSSGEQLDSSEGSEPMVYLHGMGNIIPGLEQSLSGRQAGDKFDVSIPPELAYGWTDANRVQVVSRDMFEGMDIEIGMQFYAEVSDGQGVVTITAIDGNEITLDGNHPLAGQELNFSVEVVDVRAATADELAHGHVHGAGCNHH